MSVYVDKLREYPGGPRGHKKWCHLIADDLDELEKFARKLNLSIFWFQPFSFPHYDLTEGKRIQALKIGAIEITDNELVNLIRKGRNEN